MAINSNLRRKQNLRRGASGKELQRVAGRMAQEPELP